MTKNELDESIEIMKKYGMVEPEPVIDTHEVEVSYSGYTGKMPYNVAQRMMNEVWKVNPLAVFIVDGAFEKSPLAM
jgi:hypothetical protein